MKTLIIHPEDKSTDFLKVIYQNVKDKLVVTGGKTREQLVELIKTYDRVMIMGHGTPRGLLNWGGGKWKTLSPYLIDRGFIELLSENPNNVYIWCDADQFVLHHGLKGFYSGMFISEVTEANWFQIKTNQNEVDESNNRFAELMSEFINESSYIIHKNVKEQYGLLAESNPIVSYNSERLFYRG